MPRPVTGNRSGVARRIGPLTVVFVSDDTAVLERFAGLYGAFDEVASAAEDTVVAIIERVAEPESGASGSSGADSWEATVDGALCRRSPHLALIEEAVTRRINRMVLDAETDRLHLHAGAVAREGSVVLVVGTSGSGKSTLVAKLVADGWTYLSDEQLGVLDGGRLVPYPRPMTLRRGSWSLLPGLVPDDLDDVIERYEVAPGLVGSVQLDESVVPDLVVTPDLTQESTSVSALSAASAIGALLRDTLDLERAGRAGFDRLVELATCAPMVRIAGTSLDATVVAIEAEIRAGTTAATCTETVEPVAGSIVAPAAEAWQFSDGSAMVYDDESGSLAELDSAGFQAWHALATQPRDALPPEALDSPFTEALRSANLVQGDVP